MPQAGGEGGRPGGREDGPPAPASGGKEGGQPGHRQGQTEAELARTEGSLASQRAEEWEVWFNALHARMERVEASFLRSQLLNSISSIYIASEL